MVIAVDISGSSSFGSGEATIRERAADVAACLAVSALKAGDKVGLLLFTDREELWVSPKKGRRHVLRLIRDVLEFRPVSRRTSSRPRFFSGAIAFGPLPAFALGPTAGRTGALGNPAPLNAPNGFCPRPCPPSVEIFPCVLIVKRSSRSQISRSAPCPPTAAHAHGNIRLAAQKHQRLRVAAILQKMHQLRVQRHPLLLQAAVQLRHRLRYGLPVTGLYRRQHSGNRQLDLNFHFGFRRDFARSG
jgi:hypothetical protein